ncbi:glycosyltransferase family 2 protein [Pseudomonas cerasi]
MDGLYIATVTYANRGELVVKTIESAILSGSKKFIVVNNGSSPESLTLIKEMHSRHDEIELFIINNETNMGSAFAFNQAMDLSCKIATDNSWVLFLDDDNVCVNDSIKRSYDIATSNESNSIYFLYRKDRQHYADYIKTKNPEILLGEKNSFMQFTVLGYLSRFRAVKKSSEKTEPHSEIIISNTERVMTPCGPYGGMLINVNVLKKGIRPKIEMFLYFDDTEFTMRLGRSGCKLWILPNCELTDIDQSWSEVKPKRFSLPIFEAPEYKVKNTFRNRVFFERKYNNNSDIIYFFNISGFVFILLIKAILSGNIKKTPMIIKAIIDGWNFK